MFLATAPAGPLYYLLGQNPSARPHKFKGLVSSVTGKGGSLWVCARLRAALGGRDGGEGRAARGNVAVGGDARQRGEAGP